VVSSLYDERNLLFRVIRAPGDPGQSTTQSDYDADGNLIRTSQGLEDGAGVRYTIFGYDGFNRRATTTDAMGNVTTTHYDANGNMASSRVDGELVDVAGSAGNVRLAETTYSNDAMNRRVQADQSFFDTTTGTNIAGGHAISQTIYSPNSQILKTIDADNHTNSTAYDSANRRSLVTDAKGNTTAYTYDANNNVLSTAEVDLSDLSTPSETFNTAYQYDAQDRLVLTVDNIGNTTSFAYDSRDNRVTLTDARGNLTRYTYDGLNRLTATTRFLTSNGLGSGTPAGTIVTGQSWDDNSRLTGQTDANTHTTAYVYDSLNRMTGTSFADGTANSATYDVHDNKTATVDANGNQVSATYDLLNRATARTITRGSGVQGTTFESYEYDGLSRTVQAQNNDSLVTRSYDSLSHVTRETQQVVSSGATAQSVACTYDGVGNVLSCAYPGGRVVSSSYEALNRKQTISDGAGGIATNSYFGPGRVERRDYGNGTRAAYSYDGIRRMTNSLQSVILSSAPIDWRAYSWDASDNQTAINDLLEPGLDARSFSYDSVNRLVQSATAVVGPVISYSLDGVGNRLTVTGGTNAGTYFMNPAVPPADFQVNQYTTTPFDTRTYDANGNLVSAGVQQFSYDYRDRLVGVWQPATTNTVSFKYDCFGRRIEKATLAAAARYYYVGWQEVEEEDGTNAVAASYVWGNRIDELLDMDRHGQRHFYHADDLGSIRKATDPSGNVVEEYRYGDDGQPSFFDGSGAPLAGSVIGNGTLFTGRRYDLETGLYYYRSRYLDPLAGRFTTRDTIGIWGDQGNLGNGYTYAGSDPFSAVDAMGTKFSDDANQTKAQSDPTDQVVEAVVARLLSYGRNSTGHWQPLYLDTPALLLFRKVGGRRKVFGRRESDQGASGEVFGRRESDQVADAVRGLHRKRSRGNRLEMP
jgi:RHS repeat-associated protein